MALEVVWSSAGAFRNAVMVFALLEAPLAT